jgi:tetratricopeptide (TPR) repeat protein
MIRLGCIGLLFGLFAAGSATGQTSGPAFKVGDRVAVRELAKLFVGGKIVGDLPAGTVSQIAELQGPWLRLAEPQGWVEAASVIPLDAAIEYFSKAVQADARTAANFTARGNVWQGLGKYANALSDYGEAIKIEPDALAYNNRGYTQYLLGLYKSAVSDFDAALRMAPNDAFALNNRGHNHYLLGNYKQALADYTACLKVQADHAVALNNRAWLLATCPDNSIRNGKQAVADAERACDLTQDRDFDFLDSLAAAYAEAGQFDDAVEVAKIALETAPEEARGDIRARIDQYSRKVAHRSK